MFKLEEKIWLTKERAKGVVKEIEGDNYKVTFFKDEKRETKWFEENDIVKFIKKDEIFFAKVKPDAKIPNKRLEDGAYDIYACFEEDYIEIKPGEIKLIPTGIASCFSPKYRLSLRERGSSGSKGLAKRAGEVDSGYRNEIFFALNNTTNKTIYIAKKEMSTQYAEGTVTIYPYEKAICQGALEFVPNVIVKEITYEQLKKIPSKRGMGNLGSTLK